MSGENRPSFAERFNQSIEARIEADKIKNTRENGIDLLKNSTVLFGFDNDEKRGELMERVFARYGKGDRSFQDMVDRSNNPNGNKSVAMADKDSFVRSVFMAINASVSGDSLVTDEMSPEDIDSYLPESCKGVGEEIKSINLSRVETDKMIQIGKEVSVLLSGDNIVSVKIKAVQNINELVKAEPESSLIKQYATISTSMVEDLAEEGRRQDRSRQNFRPRVNQDGEVEGGVEMAWQVSPDALAEAMKFMDPSVRWQSYTPPEWFKNLDGETQARIEYMVMICEGGSLLNRAGTDVEKIVGNPMYTAFDNEKFTTLFNRDFKLVMSKMLHDLCEFGIDPSSKIKYLRYKEKWYVEDSNGNKVESIESDPNAKKAIDQGVEEKLIGIRGYKDSLADFLAKQNGRDKASFMDKMNAYSAWNLFYMFGDSSVADRMRSFRMSSGLISDGIRTFNPESKAKSKWKVSSGDKAEDDSKLFESEYYSGQIGDRVQTIMKMERELGHSIDGKGGKSMREKIMDGTFPIFRNRMYYGFFDFISGDNLYKKDGVGVDGRLKWEKYKKEEDKTLSSLLMDYASFDENGEVVSEQTSDSWSFGNSQVDFLKFFRDHQEVAAFSLTVASGKAEAKDPRSFARKMKDEVGVARGVQINGRRLGYADDPTFYANLLWGSMLLDNDSLSSDYIRLKVVDDRGGQSSLAYSLFINDLLSDTMGLFGGEFGKKGGMSRLMNLLGVDIESWEKPDGLRVLLRNDVRANADKQRTIRLKRLL